MKTNKDRTWRRLFYILLILTIAASLVMVSFEFQLRHEKLKTLACMELFTFSLEQFQYSLDKLNITIEEFNADFLRFKVEEMIKEGEE